VDAFPDAVDPAASDDSTVLHRGKSGGAASAYEARDVFDNAEVADLFNRSRWFDPYYGASQRVGCIPATIAGIPVI
jgi:hypothetical protein